MMKDWKKISLGDIGSCHIGLTYKPEDVCDNEGTLVLRSSNIKEAQITYQDNVFVSCHVSESSRVRKGDILICVRNGSKSLIGKSALISETDDGHAFGAFMATFRSPLNDYVFQFLQTHEFKRQVHRTLGATINQITNADLKKIEFLLPPLAEQERIVEILSDADAAIAIAERQIEMNKSLLRTIISVEMKSVSSAKKMKIGNFLTESRLPDLVANPEHRLSVRLHLKGVEARPYRGTEAIDATKFFGRKSRQLIYGKQNIFNGAIGLIPDELDGYASTQDIPAFDIASDINPKWLYYFISQPQFYRRLEAYASGSGSKRLHPSELLGLSIEVPTLSQQKASVERIATAEKIKELSEKLCENLKKQKRGLMQQLLTGKLRVPEKQEAKGQ